VTSPALFENFFLSEIGVAEALQKLSQAEISLLHLLKSGGKAVDISFFQPLYKPKPGPSWRYLTFTQRYQDTFQQVRQNLVRRGVLLIAEDARAINASTKMERWRFRFPQEFEKFLPSPFTRTRTFEDPGEFNDNLVRAKLLELVGVSSAVGHLKGTPYRLRLADGQLYMGDKRFQVKYLQEWQQAEWSFVVQMKKTKPVDSGVHFVSPLEAVTYALSLLKPQEWLAPQELAILLGVFCQPESGLEAEQICQAGWQWGCLVKQVAEEQTYYRLPPDELLAETELEPDRYLHLDSAQTLGVNLHRIPYRSLQYLAQTANLHTTGQQLVASPSLVKMGRSWSSIQSQPLTVWLQKNVPAFAGAMKTLKERWGQQIVHQDLFIAKVKDLSLKVAIQKAISDPAQIIFLPDDFMAFPKGQLDAVERVVNKTGHVIKWVKGE
jgi:hypothetical protein